MRQLPEWAFPHESIGKEERTTDRFTRRELFDQVDKPRCVKSVTQAMVRWSSELYSLRQEIDIEIIDLFR